MAKDKKNQSEELLREAACIAAEEMAAEIEMPTEDIEFSEKHKARIEAIFASARKRECMIKLSRLSKIAACFVGLAIIVSSAAWFGVTGWKRSSVDYHFEPENPGTQVSITDGRPTTYSAEFIFLGYVPGGFAEAQKQSDDNIESVRLERDGHWIEFSAYIGDTFDLDSIDGNEIKAIKINKNKGMLVADGDTNHIFWNGNDFGFRLSGSLPENELEKIAEAAECYR